MDSYLELLKVVLPPVLIDHFDLQRSESKEGVLHLYFEEQSAQPSEFSSMTLVSKGFYDEITVQDFPLRGQFVYLHIRRRRWTNKEDGSIVKRNWELVASGTRYTQDFAAFLKELDFSPANFVVILIFSSNGAEEQVNHLSIPRSSGLSC